MTHTPPVPSLAFAATTICGTIGLTLAREAGATGSVTGMEQVLRLAQAEPLLRSVETWLNAAWDPQPCPAGETLLHPALWQRGWRAQVRDTQLAPLGTCLYLLPDALPPPPTAPLLAPALEWQCCPAQVRLSHLSESVLAQLEPQALLWLPSAFAPSWQVQLHATDAQLPPCWARLDLTAQQLVFDASSPIQELGQTDHTATAHTPQVILTQEVHIPLDCWLGWEQSTPHLCPLPQPWMAQLRRGQIVHAHGALLPLAQGCGLLLDSVTQHSLG